MKSPPHHHRRSVRMWRCSGSALTAGPVKYHAPSGDSEERVVSVSSSFGSSSMKRPFKRRRLLPIHRDQRNGYTLHRRCLSNDDSSTSSSGSSDSDSEDDHGLGEYDEFERTVTPSPEPPSKRVRFVPTLVTSETTVDRFDSNHPDLKKQDLWWNKDERASFMGANRRLIDEFESNQSEKVNHYLQVFERCSESPSEATSEYLERATVQIPAAVRGLEVYFCSPMKERRKIHVDDVLTVQGQLLNGDDGHRHLANIELCTKILGARSLQSSRPSRIMARLIGEGDAAACAEESE